MNIGMTDLHAPAIMGESRDPLANIKVLSPTCTVYIVSLEVTRNGQKKVF